LSGNCRATIRDEPPDPVDVLPEGLDPEWVTGGVNLGRVRRPLPIAKALRDVVLACEMNGEPLPPDHGHPVRLVVPGWIGISAIKWLGRVEVSTTALLSPWNTQFYRLFGPDYPADGELISRQTIKSAFELPWPATLPAGKAHHLYGRSWSGNGAIATIEVSTDGGTTWQHATKVSRSDATGWQRWRITWRPPAAGDYTLRARATDATGASQPRPGHLQHPRLPVRRRRRPSRQRHWLTRLSIFDNQPNVRRVSSGAFPLVAWRHPLRDR
jgi:Oxidoreductase molybdopterin binding domain/Mo-co oxidoreductase dimerisation domain